MRPSRFSSKRRLAVLGALLSLTACATKGDLRNVTTELRALSARQDSLLVALQRQAMITQDSLRGTTSQLLEVRGTVNQQLARIQQELGMLRQENAQFAQLLAGIRDQLERLSRMSTSVAPAPTTSAGSEPSGSANSDAVEAFQTALEMFNVRNYNTARSAFQRVIQQYPNSEVAPEAQFKLGEILVAERKPTEAIAAFQQIRQIWPSAPKVPDAMLQIGIIHAEQQRWPDARRSFQFVIDSYPSTSAATTAQERLRALPPGQ